MSEDGPLRKKRWRWLTPCRSGQHLPQETDSSATRNNEVWNFALATTSCCNNIAAAHLSPNWRSQTTLWVVSRVLGQGSEGPSCSKCWTVSESHVRSHKPGRYNQFFLLLTRLLRSIIRPNH